MIADSDKTALVNLEDEAEKQLSLIASQGCDVSEDTIGELDRIACAAAKITFGSDSPESLSDDMYSLIKWTDHLDDKKWTQMFRAALTSRPLLDPWEFARANNIVPE